MSLRTGNSRSNYPSGKQRSFIITTEPNYSAQLTASTVPAPIQGDIYIFQTVFLSPSIKPRSPVMLYSPRFNKTHSILVITVQPTVIWLKFLLGIIFLLYKTITRKSNYFLSQIRGSLIVFRLRAPEPVSVASAQVFVASNARWTCTKRGINNRYLLKERSAPPSSSLIGRVWGEYCYCAGRSSVLPKSKGE